MVYFYVFVLKENLVHNYIVYCLPAPVTKNNTQQKLGHSGVDSESLNFCDKGISNNII